MVICRLYNAGSKLKTVDYLERYLHVSYDISKIYRFLDRHICICFTAYTILLELERILKAAKSDITIQRAQELTKNMYAVCYIHDRSKLVVEKILGMDEEQRKLYNLVDMDTQS